MLTSGAVLKERLTSHTSSKESIESIRKTYDAKLKLCNLRIRNLESELQTVLMRNKQLELESHDLRRKLERQPLRDKTGEENHQKNQSVCNLMHMQPCESLKSSSRPKVYSHTFPENNSDCDLIPTQFTLAEDDAFHVSNNRFTDPQDQHTNEHSFHSRRGSITLSDRYDMKLKHERSDSVELVDDHFDVSYSQVPSSPIQLKAELKYEEEIKDSYEDSQDDPLLSLSKANTDTRRLINAITDTQLLPHLTTTYKKRKEDINMDLTQNPFKKRDWILEDFKVNPAMNDNVPYAYHVVVRGAKRRCIHGTTCQDCDNFYRSMGDIKTANVGPKWNDNNDALPFEVVKMVSRHRDLWDKVDSPPGFGQFDFPSTQERIKNKEEARVMKKRMAYERLYSALHDKRWLFKNEELNKCVNDARYTLDQGVFLKYLAHEEKE